MSTSLPISCWAAEDRPTYRLETKGVKSLSDVELLSIIIGSGMKGKNAVEIARELFSNCDNDLTRLSSLDFHRLIQNEGIGNKCANKILAVIELGRRITGKTPLLDRIESASDAYVYMRPKILGLEVEEFWAIMLNQNSNIKKAIQLSRGGIAETSVDIRILMKEAVLCNATCMIVCHNHPSGSTHPSSSDDKLTQSIQNACNIMRIRLMDHVVLTDNGYYSYHENGKL